MMTKLLQFQEKMTTHPINCNMLTTEKQSETEQYLKCARIM